MEAKITKQRVSEIIEYFETVEVIGTRGSVTTSRVEPVRIGDVLDKMTRNKKLNWDILLDKWLSCCFTKSLQTIAEEGWEEVYRSQCCGMISKEMEDCGCDKGYSLPEQQLKPEVEALFKFLDTLEK